MSLVVEPTATSSSMSSPAAPGGSIWRCSHSQAPPAARTTTTDEHADDDHRPLPPAHRFAVLLPLAGLEHAVGVPVVGGVVVVGVQSSLTTSPRSCSGGRASSQDCRITAAATLSTTRRRALASSCWSISERSADTVDRRSSQVSTGTGSAAAQLVGLRQRSAWPRGRGCRPSRAAGRPPPARPRARPRARRCGGGRRRRSPLRASTSYGVAIVPERHRDADPLRSEVDGEGSHGLELRRCPAAARTRSRASSRPSGSLPPATTRRASLAAAALDRLGGIGEEGAGVEPGLVGGGGHQRRAAALGRAAEHDGPDARAGRGGDRQLAQVVAVGAVDPGHDDAVDGVVGQVAGGGAGQLLLAGP